MYNTIYSTIQVCLLHSYIYGICNPDVCGIDFFPIIYIAYIYFY